MANNKIPQFFQWRQMKHFLFQPSSKHAVKSPFLSPYLTTPPLRTVTLHHFSFEKLDPGTILTSIVCLFLIGESYDSVAYARGPLDVLLLIFDLKMLVPPWRDTSPSLSLCLHLSDPWLCPTLSITEPPANGFGNTLGSLESNWPTIPSNFMWSEPIPPASRQCSMFYRQL